MDNAIKLHLLVTVKRTLKALIAALLVCLLWASIHLLCSSIFSYSPSTVCSPACVNGVCNATTFTCDCSSNFEGSTCNTPSMYCIRHSPSVCHVLVLAYFILEQFAIQCVFVELAMIVPSPVTVQITLKALIVALLVCLFYMDIISTYVVAL